MQPIASKDLSVEVFNLWNDFEHGDSAEAVFLRGVNRFLPMFHNYKTKGHSWVKHGITKKKALAKNSHIEASSKALWDLTKDMLDESQAKGWIG